MFCSLYYTPEVIPTRSRVSRNSPRRNKSRRSRRQPLCLLSPCFCVRPFLAVIFIDIFSRGRGSTDPNASRLYLLLRDAKQMLSTWAAWSNIIIKSRGMIERCRMLIIAFRRVATGRQVCFTVYLLFLDGSVSSTSRVS